MFGRRMIHHSIVTLHSGLAKYYYHKVFYKLAADLISIFIPIYLLMLGFPLIDVALWMLVVRGVQPFFTSKSAKIASIIGIRKTMLTSLLLSPVFFFMLWQIEYYPVLFMVTAIMKGFLGCTYWSQEVTLFIEVSKSKSAGFEQGIVSLLVGPIGMFAPFIGGLILTISGMPLLISISAVLYVISIIPLLSIKKIHFKLNLHKHDHSKKHHISARNLIDMLYRGFVHQFMEVIFPTLLFVLGMQILEIGFVGSMVGLIGIFIPMIIGKMIDKKLDFIVAISYAMFSIGWLLMFLFPERAILYIVVVIFAIISHALWISVCKRICILGKSRDPSYFGTATEIFDDTGAGVAALLFFTLLMFVSIQMISLIVMLIGVIMFAWKIRNMRLNDDLSMD
jgi:hypothetical protein